VVALPVRSMATTVSAASIRHWVSWDMAPAAHFYARVSESSRTPTAIELGCADPANPCKLPNAMAGDPPLRQVVTRTQEAGLRGRSRAV
jgi:hypothetical protein